MEPNPATDIEAVIRDKLAVLAPESLELLDESGKHAGHAGAQGGGGHYQLFIVSRAFENQPLQMRHRMVYKALDPLMQGRIHALAIKAYTPDEI